MNNICFGCMASKSDDGSICNNCGYDNMAVVDTSLYIKPGTIINNYIFGKVLGHGGFGITYIGKNTQTDEVDAIKEYFPSGQISRSTSQVLSVYTGKENEYKAGLAKFRKEANLIAKFNDFPGIVDAKDYFESNNTGYFVMEYVKGVTLKEYVEQKGGRIPFNTAKAILMPIMDALEEMHRHNIIHRDISPDNIYITNDKRIKLLDFGAARYANYQDNRSLSIILKHGYAPKEQYYTKGNQGPWTDVYALAATTYYMLTGQTPQSCLERVERDELVRPSRLGADIGFNEEDILMVAMSIKENERYQSMKSFQAAIARTISTSQSGQQTQNSRYNQQGVPSSGYNQQSVPNSGYNQQGVPNSGYNQQGVPNSGYNQQGVPNSGYNQQGAVPQQTGYQQNVMPNKNGYSQGSLPYQPVYNQGAKPRSRNKKLPWILGGTLFGMAVIVGAIILIISLLPDSSLNTTRNDDDKKVSNTTTNQTATNKPAETITAAPTAAQTTRSLLSNPTQQPAINEDNPVPFTDANFKKAVETSTGIVNITNAQAKEIKYIDIASSGVIDISGVEYFTNIQEFYAYDNSIKDITLLSSLQMLKSIEIANNLIEEITILPPNIEMLLIDNNSLTYLPDLSQYTSLLYLYAYENFIETVPMLPYNISGIDFGYNWIAGIESFNYSDYNNLTYINLSDNIIVDISPLANITSLTYLDISNNYIEDFSPIDKVVAGLTDYYNTSIYTTDGDGGALTMATFDFSPYSNNMWSDSLDELVFESFAELNNAGIDVIISEYTYYDEGNAFGNTYDMYYDSEAAEEEQSFFWIDQNTQLVIGASTYVYDVNEMSLEDYLDNVGDIFFQSDETVISISENYLYGVNINEEGYMDQYLYVFTMSDFLLNYYLGG